MLTKRLGVSICSTTVMVLGAGGVSGQAYPNKPIRVLAAEPGGGNDFVARLIAQGISAPLGQPVVVENRTAIISYETAFKASPDGYTLFVAGSTFWIGPLLQKTPYDAAKDFSPITMMTRSPYVLVVHPSVPVKSVKELVALAKARPGELNYAAGSTGSGPHLAGELFKAMANVNIVRINYKGTGPAVNAVIGGEVQLMFSNGSAVAPHFKAGRLRVLAVTSTQPSALYPELPTVTASGLPGFEIGNTSGMFAPAKTPIAIINRLNQDIARVLSREDVKEKFLNTGVEATSSSPAQFAATIKSEIIRMGKVIKDAGIKAE